ncbi:MAG: lipid-A-disaccharide synthase [Planctomycetaceae bacterium]
MHIFLSAGEPSGDQHAAHLIAELRRRRPDLEFSGLGGPHMERAGCRLLYRLTDLAVMGVWAVIPLLRTFFRLVKQAECHFRETGPDAVILVDFPGFNWHIARKAKAAGIPVFYFLPPQLWAWAPWRVRKMRKFVDCVLCGLPFEPDWYAARDVEAEYVGHPFFDEVAERRLDADFCETLTSGSVPVLGVLPGSRDREIERNWPMMLGVLDRVHARLPDVRLAVASCNDRQRNRCMELHAESGRRLPLEFSTGKTSEIIEAAAGCLMVSGSVSLELLARTTPACVVYGVSRFLSFCFQQGYLNVDYITLPNLFADAPVFPEWIFPGNPETVRDDIAGTLCEWLSDRTALTAKVAELTALRDAFVRTGAIANTANAVLQRLPASVVEQTRAA